MKYEITEKTEGKSPTTFSSNRSFNELELLAEELERVQMFLTIKGVPTHDENNTKYSAIGRVKLYLKEN